MVTVLDPVLTRSLARSQHELPGLDRGEEDDPFGAIAVIPGRNGRMDAGLLDRQLHDGSVVLPDVPDPDPTLPGVPIDQDLDVGGIDGRFSTRQSELDGHA